MKRPFRLPTLILLPLLVVGALLVQSRSDETSDAEIRLAELTATASAPATPSSTWYCAAGSATGVSSGEGAGPAEQRVIVANNSGQDSTGTVTLYPEGGTPKEVPLQVGANAHTVLVVSEQVTAPWVAALVETTGGEVTVAHELSGPTGRSVANCSSTPSGEWYFPAGTTRVGTDMWIALFNPFPGEATVDISFDTDDGARTPESFQGLVVPGGSVVVKRVGQSSAADGSADAPVSLQDRVATTVSVRSGRIVAEQVQSFVGREGGTRGLTSTLGSTTPSAIWAFPSTAPSSAAGVGESVAVFNPGGSDTEVLVQVQLEDPAVNGTVEPFEVTIPAHRVAVVDIGADERVPTSADGGRVPHWVVVRSADGSDLVAERVLTGPGGAGLTYAMGLPVGSTRWLSTVAVPRDVGGTQLSIANPSETSDATVTIRRIGDGNAADLADAAGLTIAPGELITTRDLRDLGFTPGDTVEVLSDVPVVVGQWMSFASEPQDVSTPLGVPVNGTQSLLVAVVGPSIPASSDELDLDAPGGAPPLPGEVTPDTATEPDAGAGADGSTTTTSTAA